MEIHPTTTSSSSSSSSIINRMFATTTQQMQGYGNDNEQPSSSSSSSMTYVSIQKHTNKGGVDEEEEDSSSSSSSSLLLSDHIDTSNTTIIKETKRMPNGTTNNNFTRYVIVLLSWIRFICIDISYFSILLLFSTMNWLQYVQENYIMKQAESFYWTNERKEQEHTYYTRYCTTNDLSTNTTADLFIPDSSNPNNDDDVKHISEIAASIQLQHGFTFIPNVLSYQTMKELRTHIDYKNHHDKQLFVIEKKHRYNILLGTEHVSVRNALIEIANHTIFRNSLEAMLGPNPALVEMTAISSSAGAQAQYWHQDVNEESSATNHMQSFGPVYSVFIQLQNTTRAMGATSICPGSHYCTEGPIGAYCEAANIQAVHPITGYSGGDALIMNMNSYHRGAAHYDTNAPDRIMLILSFTPKPAEKAERRQLSSGFTYQLRWDMWGHTLNDMKHAHTTMRQPWATLRSLGLYKPSYAEWGIDYIMQSTQRILHHDNGFSRYNLDEFIDEGGFPFIPTFLQEFSLAKNESWFEFLLKTFKKCIEFTRKAAITATVTYIVLGFLLWIVSKPQQRAHRYIANRFIFIIAIVGTFNLLSKYVVDQSNWAKDIKAKRRYTSTVPYDMLLYTNQQNYYNNKNHIINNELLVPFIPSLEVRDRTTYPTRNDLLIETRLGAPDLGIYNHFIDGHPGNKVFRNLITSYIGSPSNLEDSIVHNIVQSIATQHGRFLFQYPDGMWGALLPKDIELYVRNQLWLTNNPTTQRITEYIRYGLTSVRYGIYRDTALAKYHTHYLMYDLQRKIIRHAKQVMNNTQESSTIASDSTHITPNRILRTTTIRRLPQPTVQKHQQPVNTLNTHAMQVYDNNVMNEPSFGAWITQNDIVEVYVDGLWYGAKVQRITADGYYHFHFMDGDIQKVTSEKVRRIRTIQPQEVIEVYIQENNEYTECEVINIGDNNNNDNDTITVKKLDDDTILYNISPLIWRRKGGRLKTKPDVFTAVYTNMIDDTIDINDMVEVIFDDNQWYTGIISDISIINDENNYVIDFIDGTQVDNIPETELRMIQPYSIGEIIHVYIQDGYYECELLEIIHERSSTTNGTDGTTTTTTYKAKVIDEDQIIEDITSLHIGRKN